MAEMEGLYLSPDRAQRVTAAPEETESGRQHGDGFRIILQLDERTLWRNIGEKVGTTLRRSPAGSAAVKKTAARVGHTSGAAATETGAGVAGASAGAHSSERLRRSRHLRAGGRSEMQDPAPHSAVLETGQPFRWKYSYRRDRIPAW